MTTGLIPERTVHLHLTRRCNLACRHCYSASSPRATEAVETAETLAALATLRREGYEVLALSGGEPFLHPDCGLIAAAARAMGYRVSVITNGILVTERMLDALARDLTAVAVSFDGAEARHNAMRGRPDAYARAVRALGLLREREIPFALSCTASRDGLEDVVDLYLLGETEGAVAVQVSPVVAVGRAEGAGDLALTEAEKARLHLMTHLLDAAEGGPRMRCELQPQTDIQAARGQFGILSERVGMLSDLVNPLVITETGHLQPFAYGLDRSYDIARVGPEMPEQIARWKDWGRPELARLVARSFDAPEIREQDYVEWYADLVRISATEPAGTGPIRRSGSGLATLAAS